MDTLDARRASIRARIASIRAALQSRNLAALVVPSSDPHLSEYLPDHWKGREFFSGFTGSVGTLIVTPGFAGVWVDGRYWVQAEAQLAGTGIELMKLTGVGATAHVDWLAAHLQPGDLAAVDGNVLGLAAARQLQSALAARGIDLVSDHDVLNDVWTERPPLPVASVFEHVAPFAPTPRAAKLAMVRTAMKALGATHHFVSTVDDIAWLTNLRGADVQYNPVFLAHLLIDGERATLFIGEGKIAPALKARLETDGVLLAPYARAAAALAALPSGATLLVDPRRVTHGLRQSVARDVAVIESINPSTLAKSRKTDSEAHHIRAAMEQDGAALAEFFAWFEGALGHETITELTIDEHVTAARARRPGYVCPSFPTIAGFNANGALPHYRATEEAHATICMRGTIGDGLLLIDSGGQYEYGTTDITRVVAVGHTTAEQRRDFTLVLKGMIALSRAKFPRGTRSPLLDSIARAPIWAEFADYGHGTGHGVGYFLNVHEGPHGITPHLPPEPHTAMEPGMVTSNEPGLYRPGRWGVRIENLVLNVPAMTTEFGEFLQFETLTLCPIDTRLVDRSMISADELMWLDSYHAEVRRRIGPHVSGPALAWLTERTQPLG
ncbi:MAG TPA: aminopeptidase P family protein [Burkholderiaceae bacterium]|nr:aminopeptidase P family protein [Burkholderiaceae bacterium]